VAHKLTFRQLLLSMLALWYDLSHKEIGARAGMTQKRVSQHLKRGEIRDWAFERLHAAVGGHPAAVPVVTACLEGLAAVHAETGLTAEEATAVEAGALEAARRAREGLTAAVHLSRAVPAEGYPDAAGLADARRRAAELWARLRGFPDRDRSALVRAVEEYQGWALCERVCEESERAASRKVERAAALARLAREIAERVRGPEGWRNTIRGYAAGYEGNALRVGGELKTSEVTFAEARRLWRAGSDPGGVLDPGRILDLEASLCRAQRRFEEALSLLDEAAAVGRSPARALIKRGFTLEVMGEYERAVETLLRAAPLADVRRDPRLANNLRLNLAVNYCHIGRYKEASELVREARPLTAELGDEMVFVRITWLEGRIAAGLGRPVEGRRLLAAARRRFMAEGMSYDVALALLEEAALFLESGQTAEVKALVRELPQVFAAQGVHREALAALRLFQEAAERETATADLARRVLCFLFRARHDQGLRFHAS